MSGSVKTSSKSQKTQGSQKQQPGSTGSSAKPKPDVPKGQVDWVRNFAAAAKKSDEKVEIDRKRGEAVSSATLNLRTCPDDLAGIKFDMVLKSNASLKTMLLAAVGKQKTMTSLTGTGDAMEEIDTEHDLHQLEEIDPEKLKKAGAALKLVADASQELDGKLMALYCSEFAIDPKEFEALSRDLDAKKREEAEARSDPNKRSEMQGRERERQEQAKKDRQEGKPKSKEELAREEKEQKLAEFEKLRAKVEQDVRDEVWQPLVRQGLIPENFVPDRHSEVARTFAGASDVYLERLDEYAASMGENAELIKKLNLAQKITDQTLKVVSAVAGAVPGGDSVTQFIQTGVECATILSDTSFQVAGQVLQKDDAVNVAQTVASGISGILGASGVVPEEVQLCVNSGMEIALTGGKAVKAIMDGKPEDVLAAIGSGLQQSLSLAAKVSGNPDVAMAAESVAASVATIPAARKLIQAMTKKPVSKQAVQDALSGLITQVLTDVNDAVTMAVQAEEARGELSATTGQKIDQGMQIGTEVIGGLVSATLAENKAAALAAAIGKIAGDVCSTYMPDGYGGQVGTILKNALTGGPKLVEAIRSKDPATAIAQFGSILGTALTQASQMDGVPSEVASALGIAGTATKSGATTLKGAKEFEAAVKSGDVAGVRKAAAKMVNAVMDPVLDEIDPEALSSDGTLVSAGDDDSADTSGETIDPSSELGEEMEKSFEEQRRAVIAKCDQIIKAGGDTEEAKKKIADAKQMRDKAVKELLERNAFMEEVAASSKEFEAMLNSDLAGESEEDENEGDTRTLKALITTIQRDRKIMQMADSLVGMGLQAAAAFFPPMGAVMDFKTFAVEASKAVAHLQQLLVWKQNATEARNAVTVQVHAMLNRVGLEEDAVIEHQIKSTLALISGIGNIIATAGAHAAPAGVAMSAAAKAARASLDLALTIKSAAEMERAWNKFQKALQNPRDRKNIRMAIEKNPTLAKYALVWGALNDNNPIAKKALKRCGLTDPIIAKEQANVKGVIEYLEVLYNDDPIVLKAVPDTSGWGWKAPRPELTLRCWTSFLSIAQTKASPKMAAGSGGAITAALGPLETAKAALAKARKAQERVQTFKNAHETKRADEEQSADPQELEGIKKTNDKRGAVIDKKLQAANKLVTDSEAAVTAALKGIAKACVSFKALDEKGKPYPRIAEWVQALAALAELELREMAGQDVGLQTEPEQKVA